MEIHEETDPTNEPFIHESSKKNTADSDKAKTHIRRSHSTIWLVLFYAVLVLFSWIVLCLLTYRPVTAKHYRWTTTQAGASDSLALQYQQNERWYKAAQVVQSIAGVLTIPVTSAVCSSAAVVYLQYSTGGRRPPNVTLRQMTVLADKGWTDVGTYVTLATGQWSRYSSPFLVWAVLLHVLGAVIAPLQQIFISPTTIKTPTYAFSVASLLDIPDKLDELSNGLGASDATVALTRQSLASTSSGDYLSQLWSGDVNCSDLVNPTADEFILCAQGGGTGTTLYNMSILADPFLAQLPRDFNTGLIQQFLPRFNATANYENISAADFPADCDTIPGALSIRQSNTDAPGPLNTTTNPTSSSSSYWSVHACMPTDLRISPWKYTRARQDFTEELYINVSLSRDLLFSIFAGADFSPGFSEYFRITVNTTAGYFELPNYMNGQKAGPLLNDDPTISQCGESCVAQSLAHGSSRRSTTTTQSTENLEALPNKGPLLTTSLALFGPNSWLDLNNRYSDLYNQSTPEEEEGESNTTASEICIDLVPLGRMVNGFLFENPLIECVTPGSSSNNNNNNNNNTTTLKNAAYWLFNLRRPGGEASLSNAFTIAAYLATLNWISGEPLSSNMSWVVAYDLGQDSQKPSISLAGIVVISVLVALDLLGLLATAIYASSFPRWADSLNALSLLKLGSSIGEGEGGLSLKVSVDDSDVRVLDELPGWIGGAAWNEDDDVDDDTGRIALGGGQLRPDIQYQAYDGEALRRKLEQQGRKRRWCFRS